MARTRKPERWNRQARPREAAGRLTRRQFLVRGATMAAGATLGTLAASTVFSPHSIVTGQEKTLRITGWGGRFGTIHAEQIIPKFEAEYKAKVVVDRAFPFEPKLMASPRRNPIYDVLHSNAPVMWRAMDAGYLVRTYSPKEIPNLADVYEYAYGPHVPGVIAWVSGIGLAYRTDRVTTPPSSWKDLWEARFAGKRGTYVIFNTLGQALFLMAGQLFGKGQRDLEAAFKAMEALKPVKLVDFTGTMERMLLAGEVDVGVLHDSGVYRYTDADQPPPLGWVLPREGAPALEQTFAVTVGSRVKELAYAYIDFILRPEIQRTMAKGVWYGTANRKVRLAGRFEGRVFDTPRRVASLVQFDWRWFNRVYPDVSKRYTEIMAR
jgi:putative spermidine/putrescine transport system substrate-binding protein